MNQRTCLYDLHLAEGAKMVPFAGYDMPVQYPQGVMQEHLHTRRMAGLFDVSHMGQILIRGPQAAREIESLMPADVLDLAEGQQRYSMFTNEAGGILDDVMIANRGNHFLLVVNAARKQADLQLLTERLTADVEYLPEQALLAIQGPWAATALSALLPGIDRLRFMQAAPASWKNKPLWVSRSGYTGEDGFELSLPDSCAEAFARALLEQDGVRLIGLGARDSLRTEAGLCLYGHDITTETSPVEAALDWAIAPARRKGATREGGFPGAGRILAELASGPTRRRVGLRPDGRGAMREGTLLFATESDVTPIGFVTSGLFGPSLGAPVALGYLPNNTAASGTRIFGAIRNKRIPATICKPPFLPHHYVK